MPEKGLPDFIPPFELPSFLTLACLRAARDTVAKSFSKRCFANILPTRLCQYVTRQTSPNVLSLVSSAAEVRCSSAHIEYVNKTHGRYTPSRPESMSKIKRRVHELSPSERAKVGKIIFNRRCKFPSSSPAQAGAGQPSLDLYVRQAVADSYTIAEPNVYGRWGRTDID